VIVIIFAYVQSFYKITAVNPQVGSGYFSYPIMVYDGDTVPRVVDRIKRRSGIPGKNWRNWEGVCSKGQTLEHRNPFS